MSEFFALSEFSNCLSSWGAKLSEFSIIWVFRIVWVPEVQNCLSFSNCLSFLIVWVPEMQNCLSFQLSEFFELSVFLRWKIVWVFLIVWVPEVQNCLSFSNWLSSWGAIMSEFFELSEFLRCKIVWVLQLSEFFELSEFQRCKVVWVFGQKWLSPRKNFVMGKNFRFRDFRFKIHFKTFCFDSDQKIFRSKFSDLAIFSLFWPKND